MEPTQAVQLVEDAPFAAIGLDASLRIVGWNAAASRLFGAEAALGEDIAARIPGVDAAVWIELVATGTARSTLAGRAIEWTAVTSRATDGRPAAARLIAPHRSFDPAACCPRAPGPEQRIASFPLLGALPYLAQDLLFGTLKQTLKTRREKWKP